MSEFKNDDRYKSLERVNAWVANCDAKASYLLTLLGIVFTIVATSGYSTKLESIFKYIWIIENLSIEAFLRLIEAIALYACFGFLLKTLSKIYHVLFAKVDSGFCGQRGLVSNSLLFFGTIAQHSFIEFSEKCNGLSEADLQAHIDSQVYINSKICQLKFENYNKALKFCRYAVFASLIVVFINWCLLRLT